MIAADNLCCREICLYVVVNTGALFNVMKESAAFVPDTEEKNITFGMSCQFAIG